MAFVVFVRPGQPGPFLAGLFGCSPALLAISVWPTNSISGVAVSASIIVLLHRCLLAFRPCRFSRFASVWPVRLPLFVPMRSSLSGCLIPVWLCLFFFCLFFGESEFPAVFPAFRQSFSSVRVLKFFRPFPPSPSSSFLVRKEEEEFLWFACRKEIPCFYFLPRLLFAFCHCWYNLISYTRESYIYLCTVWSLRSFVHSLQGWIFLHSANFCGNWISSFGSTRKTFVLVNYHLLCCKYQVVARM